MGYCLQTTGGGTRYFKYVIRTSFKLIKEKWADVYDEQARSLRLLRNNSSN